MKTLYLNNYVLLGYPTTPANMIFACLLKLGVRFKGKTYPAFEEYAEFCKGFTHVEFGGKTRAITKDNLLPFLKEMGFSPMPESGKIEGKKNMGNCQCGDFCWSVEWSQFGKKSVCRNTNWEKITDHVPYVGTVHEILSSRYLIPL